MKRGLRDFGVETESAESPPFLASGLDTPESQAIVKFLGSDKNRRSRSVSTMKIIEEEGCHWAVSYRRNRRPRIVQDGDIIFLGRLTRDPKDIRIFGRATAMAYKEGRDDATEANIDRRGWRSDFPHFARVYNAEFVDGPIENGVSLYELMDELETDSYEVTQENRDSGTGNTSARMAIRRQTQMRLSLEGYSWLRERLEEAFDKHGKVPRTALERLVWPDASGNSTL
ncbi:MAG: hypothetical protein OXH93_10300 [Caldilineaceae bacterium]|nr:hypothetical protein [Caldilineaceae bacterium]